MAISRGMIRKQLVSGKKKKPSYKKGGSVSRVAAKTATFRKA